MIPPRNLSLLSNRLAGAGRRIPETILERDYCLAWFLVVGGHVDLHDLVKAIEQKWDFRGIKFEEATGEFQAKKARLKKLWKTRLENQMVELPEFENVYRSVQRAFRQAGLAGRG